MRLHRFIRPLLLASLLLGLSAASFAGVFVSVAVGPPPIPVYAQPICPGVGYIWTPGYWGWGDDGYYWVPGTWILAPRPGFLWTPGYWGWSGGAYLWHGGYWGPHVGYYGGINYGFGYGGVGFLGGEWRGNNFYYNRSVTNVNVTNVTNVYNKTVIVNNNTHVSYNGGSGGVKVQPTAQERQFEHENHLEPTKEQLSHRDQSMKNPQLLAKNNGGKPAIAATSKPGEFSKGVVGAKAAGGPVNHAALTANAKNMPKANTTAAAGAGAGAKGGANTTAKGGGNVPKPSSAGTSTHANTSTTAGSHNVPKPPNASSSSGSAKGASYPTGGGFHDKTPANTNTAHGGSTGSTTHANANTNTMHPAPQPHTAPAPHAQPQPQHTAPAHNPPPSHDKPHR
jgi:hypothetical protein